MMPIPSYVPQKRPADSMVPFNDPKRSRNELILATNKDKQLLDAGIQRTSRLSAPIMLLEGHESEVYSCEFHPEGDYLASTGHDQKVLIWKVYEECENVAVLTGHRNSVAELHFSPDGGHIYTCSADKMVAVWDVRTCQRIRKMRGHTTFVNSCRGARRGQELIVSGSDDGTIKQWDARYKFATHTMNANGPVTAVCFNDTSDQILSGGLDNNIHLWDIRAGKLLLSLVGHADTITGLALSPSGGFVLSNSMDNTLRIWDIRPYAPFERCVKLFQGLQHNFEQNLLRCAWSPNEAKISCGSADRFLYIWDVVSRRLLYKLPGHNGSINDVDFHPREPIILSASSDKNLFMGEIEP